jgi:predicted membrane-bound spermidine synthase
MNYVTETANALMEIDKSTITLLLFICGVAKYMIKSHLTNSAMVFIMYPFTMLFSMGAYAVFTKFELFATNKPDQWLMWVIMASTIGVIITLGVTALLLILGERLIMRKPFEQVGVQGRS